MTWKEIKDLMNEIGIQDRDLIEFKSVDEIIDSIENLKTCIQLEGPSGSNPETCVSVWEIFI